MNRDKNIDSADNPDTNALLTIPEAAASIGIHEKRLRRLLATPEYRDRTQTQIRTTRTGERSSVCVPPGLLEDLHLHFEIQQSTDSNADNEDNKADTKLDMSSLEKQFQQAVETFQANKELFEQLRSENAYLRSELTAEREARVRGDREFRELLLRRDAEIARLQQENRLLLAVPVEEPETTVQDVQEGAQEAHTDTLETNAGISAQELEQAEYRLKTGQEAIRPKRWWEVWRR